MDNPSYETLAVQLDGHIAVVSLDRPEKANAMSAPMWSELENCFLWLDQEPGVRVVVLRGEGRHFCAGIDIAMLAMLDDASLEPGRRAEARRNTILRLQGNLTAIEDCRKPVLAAIHGSCVGGGVDLACCCDLRYCSEDAFFSIKEVDLGLVADIGTLQRLPRIIGDGLVRELAYTARRFEAAEATACGFVTRSYADRDAMLDGVMKIAADIAARSPLAIRGTKESLLFSRDHSVAEGLRYVANYNAGMMSSTDVLASLNSGGAPAKVSYDP